MKKTDKLFKDEFVHFRWDDSLEGREGFFANDIDTLQDAVNYNSSDNRGIAKKGVERKQFEFVGGFCYVFFYHDPHYEYKRAWMQGKKVQYMTTIYAKNGWQDVSDEWYWDGNGRTQYRIAPEKEWRPFKDVDELKEVWNIKLTGRTDIVHAYVLTEPMIWVRWKGGNERRLINAYNYGGGREIKICGDWVSLRQLFEQYEFIDGTPCGVLESVEEE